MIHEEETLYLHRRAEEERRRAAAAGHDVAATIHRQLADHYRDRAARIVMPHLRVG